MDERITGFVGLDAHAESTAIGFAEAGRAASRFIGTVGPKQPELTRAIGKLGEPRTLLIVYEAGPCGYGLARELGALGYRCEVVAPSKIPKKAGELTSVTIPDERDEAIRDLCRARVTASIHLSHPNALRSSDENCARNSDPNRRRDSRHAHQYDSNWLAASNRRKLGPVSSDSSAAMTACLSGAPDK